MGGLNFDAIIIADFDKSLKSVTTSLLYTDVSPKKKYFITLNQWFDQSLLNEITIQPIYYPSINKDNFENYKKKFFREFNDYPSQSGVARKNIDDFDIYREQLKQRLDPTVTIMQGINSYIKKNKKKIVFADGEDENTLKAAIAFKNSKLGTPILVGKEEKIKEQIKKIGYNDNFDIEIVNSKDAEKRTA